MERQSQLVRPGDDRSHCRVPIEPGQVDSNVVDLHRDVPGHLSALLLLHLQVVVDWMQVEVLELDPNLEGWIRDGFVSCKQSNLVSLSGSSDQPLAIHVWPVLISVLAFPHLQQQHQIHLHFDQHQPSPAVPRQFSHPCSGSESG